MKVTARKGYDETLALPGFTVTVTERNGSLVLLIEYPSSHGLQQSLAPHEARQIASLLRNGTELPIERFDFARFHDAKAAWSRKTFGPGDRYAGVVEHIRRELEEIEAQPSDLSEWVDVILLAMDGAWRSAGASGAQLVSALIAKQAKNLARKWPDWRSLQPGEVSQHIRDGGDDA